MKIDFQNLKQKLLSLKSVSPKSVAASLPTTTQIKKAAHSLLPYGKTIEKVYLFVFLVAFIVLIFKAGGSVATEEIVAILAVGAGGLFILRSLRRKIYFPKVYTSLLCVFLFIALLATIFSVNIYNSLLVLIELFAVGMFSILAYDVIYGKYSRRWILNAFTLVVTIVMLYGIRQYIIDKTALIYPLYLPAYMGTLALAFLPYSLSSAIKTKGFKKYFFMVCTGILGLSLILTFSKVVYVVGLMEIGVFTYVNLFMGRKVLRKDKFYIPLLVLAVIVALVSILLHYKTSSTIPFINTSISDRDVPLSLHLDLYKQAWGSFLSYPIIGSGFGNFKEVSLYHQTGAWNIMYSMYNDLLQPFISAGILGGIAFLSLIGYMLYLMVNKVNFIKIVKKQSPETLELSLGIVAILLMSLYFPVLEVAPILFVLFVFFGILLKALNVDNVKRYYLGNLSIGMINGLALFTIFISAYFYYFNYQYQNIQNSLSTATPAEVEKQLTPLVKFVPIDTEYSSLLSQVYLSQNEVSQASSMVNEALKYDRDSVYLRYSQALIDYFNSNTKGASKVVNKLVSEAPYADPSFYLLVLQLDQQAGNNTVFTKELNAVAKKFPINATYYLYQPIFTDLGYSSSLAKVYLELAILTKNNADITIAGELDPSSLSVFGNGSASAQ